LSFQISKPRKTTTRAAATGVEQLPGPARIADEAAQCVEGEQLGAALADKEGALRRHPAAAVGEDLVHVLDDLPDHHGDRDGLRLQQVDLRFAGERFVPLRCIASSRVLVRC
jgi:hypothetical protein